MLVRWSLFSWIAAIAVAVMPLLCLCMPAAAAPVRMVQAEKVPACHRHEAATPENKPEEKACEHCPAAGWVQVQPGQPQVVMPPMVLMTVEIPVLMGVRVGGMERVDCLIVAAAGDRSLLRQHCALTV